jgi:hypothetical protein
MSHCLVSQILIGAACRSISGVVGEMQRLIGEDLSVPSLPAGLEAAPETKSLSGAAALGVGRRSNAIGC